MTKGDMIRRYAREHGLEVKTFTMEGTVKTSDFEDLAASVVVLIAKAVVDWEDRVYKEKWPDGVDTEILVEDFIEKLRRAYEY